MLAGDFRIDEMDEYQCKITRFVIREFDDSSKRLRKPGFASRKRFTSSL